MSKSSKDPKNGQMSTGRMLRLVGRFMGGQRHTFTMAGLMLIFEAATATILPLMVVFLLNYLTFRVQTIEGVVPEALPETPLSRLGIPPIINPDVDTIAIFTIGIVVLTMINSLGDSLAEIYLAQGGRSLGYNLRVSLYAHLQKLSLAFHDQRRTGDILTRVTSDVAALEDFVISSLSDFVGSVLSIFFILFVIFTQAWQVGLVAAVIIPIMALVSNYFTQRIKAASKKRRTSEGELATAAQEMLTSIRVIQTYGLGSYEQSLFAAQSQKAMDAALETAAYQARFSWVVSVLGAISVASVIWMGVWLIFRVPVSIAGIVLLTAYIKYIQDMFKPTKRIIQEWNTFGKLYASLERIGDLLDLKPSVQDEPGAFMAPHFKGHIEFRGVNFAYPSLGTGDGKSEGKQRTALKNLNFTIEPGQVVAVVGHTGAGKSTIVQLLPRLYDPGDGEILIDGHNIREFTLESLRAQISMVLQESILFSGSVVENIAYGRPDATGAEIIAAAKQANAHEFIEKLPEGYYTMLGERGSNLSGGQRQRIAIARAFVRNTSILIMDEPTTGLDAESSELVLRALRKLMKGKTTIIISHDLQLIRDADKIIVIKAGEIEQVGSHDELIRAGGLYANLYMMQSGQKEFAGDTKARENLLKTFPGRMAGRRMSDMLNYDLPHSEQYLRVLPSMADAFDKERVSEMLQETLFDPVNPRYTIIDCEPDKAIYLPEKTLNLQYLLKLQDRSNQKVIDALVNARIFRDMDECRIYLHEQLMPLAAQANGRQDLAIFANPVAVIDSLKAAVSVFPIDGMLPTLIGATDPRRMISVFNETLPETLSGNFFIKDMDLEMAHYGRYQRCVLRYKIMGEQIDTPDIQTQRVYGKIDADGYGGLTVPVTTALREKLSSPRAPYSFRIPFTLAYLPELKLLIMEALTGEASIKQLLKARMNGEDETLREGMTLEESIEICAKIAATMHLSGIKLGRRHTLETEVEEVQAEITVAQQVYPELALQFREWLDQALEYASHYPVMPLAFSHGDFRYTQLIFDKTQGGLVDFDTVCQAEPAMDLGQFIAYQRLTIGKEQDSAMPFAPEAVEELCEIFLKTYIETARDGLEDVATLRARVIAYEIISLIRLALHSWQKLKGRRLQCAMQVLEERVACLTRVS